MPPMFALTVARALSRLSLDQPGTDPHPREPAPMLLQKADAMLSSPDWTYETSCVNLLRQAVFEAESAALWWEGL